MGLAYGNCVENGNPVSAVADLYSPVCEALSEEPGLRRAGGGLACRDDQAQPVPVLQNVTRVVRLAVMLYIRFPLLLRNVEDLLHGRGIEVSHEMVRFWWNRFGPMFTSELRRKRVSGLRSSRCGGTWTRYS